jgi:hypothetical protein
VQCRAHRARERLELRGEDQPTATAEEEQRLDAQLIPCEYQLTGALVEHRKREHAAQP